MFWRLIASSMILLAALVSGAAGSYYSEQDQQGFYWYKDPAEIVPVEPEPQQPHEKKEKAESPKKEEKKERHPSLSNYTPQELWNMYPDDLVKLEEGLRKKAVQNPSIENMREHLYIKDLARRKALAYTNSYMMALQMNPDLSLEGNSAMSAGAKNVITRLEESERENILKQNSDNYALVYFFSPACPYCKEQDRLLDTFYKRFRWTITRVNFQENRELSAKLNIIRTPSLILIKKGEEQHFPISAGIIPLDELEDRVGQGIRYLAGETTPENYTVKDYQKGGAFDAPAPFK